MQGWSSKVQHIQAMEYHAAIKKDEAILTWNVVSDMLFSEMNKLQNVIYSMSPFVLKKKNPGVPW